VAPADSPMLPSTHLHPVDDVPRGFRIDVGDVAREQGRADNKKTASRQVSRRRFWNISSTAAGGRVAISSSGC
jgi:hypothetical protein